MVCALETGLAQIGRIGFTTMALAARRYMAGRTVMMTGFAAFIHIRHLGMDLMIEMHRTILIDELV
jgi:hypothetical protein